MEVKLIEELKGNPQGKWFYLHVKKNDYLNYLHPLPPFRERDVRKKKGIFQESKL